MNRMHEFPSRVTTTDSHSFRVLLEKRKFLIETGPEREREREESFIKYSSTGTANRSPNFFHRIPSNHCETSSKLPCPNTVHIISHRSMLISSKETKRNSRFFEFIFHCRWILKKHLFVEIKYINLNCTSIREFYQFPPSFHLSTIAIVAHFDVTTQTIEAVTRSESMGSSSIRNFSIEYFAEEDRSGRFDSRGPNYTTSVESISDFPHHFNL